MSYGYLVSGKDVLVMDEEYADFLCLDTEGFVVMSTFLQLRDVSVSLSCAKQRILDSLSFTYDGIAFHGIKVVSGLWDVSSVTTLLLRVLDCYVLRVFCTACEVVLAFDIDRFEYLGIVSSQKNESKRLRKVYRILEERG